MRSAATRGQQVLDSSAGCSRSRSSRSRSSE